MLIYDIERVYKARGIESPYAFFRGNGFSESFSAKLKHGKLTGMKLESLEKLCEMLNCTPHDLLEWVPDKNSRVMKDHPLSMLESKNKPPEITAMWQSMPLEEMRKIQELIENKSKGKADP